MWLTRRHSQIINDSLELATQATNVVDYNKQVKCPGCTTKCGSPQTARPASVLYYLEVSTFRFVLVSLVKLVDSETCPSCFYSQELNKITNLHASLIAEFFVHRFQPNHSIPTKNTGFYCTRRSRQFFSQKPLRNNLLCRQNAALKPINWRRQILSCKQTRCKTDSASISFWFLNS